jgi:hypothetical protein
MAADGVGGNWPEIIYKYDLQYKDTVGFKIRPEDDDLYVQRLHCHEVHLP